MISKSKEIIQVFADKREVTLFVPLELTDYKIEAFTIELLDLIGAYLRPAMDGVNKNDIIEFMTTEKYKNYDLYAFLRYKRYIATENDIFDLFLKYCHASRDGHKKGKELALTHVNYDDVLQFEQELANAIRSVNTNEVASFNTFQLRGKLFSVCGNVKVYEG